MFHFHEGNFEIERMQCVKLIVAIRIMLAFNFIFIPNLILSRMTILFIFLYVTRVLLSNGVCAYPSKATTRAGRVTPLVASAVYVKRLCLQGMAL